MDTFQLLRPEWLLLLLPLLVLGWRYWNRRLSSRDWSMVIDPRLLPFLLVGKEGQSRRWPILLWMLLSVLAIIALSGPVWNKLPQPVFNQQSALVILLDLSSSMNAADLKPSRLARARLKLIDLLKLRKEGQTALIAYAATAYSVSPLTDDTDTIQSLVSSLTTDIMPQQGSRADLAVIRALELFENAGISKGDIILISDGVRSANVDAINKLPLKGFRLSVLAVGSEQGAPIPAPSGGFLKDAKGSIVIAKTDHVALRALASEQSGLYSSMTIDDSDLKRYAAFLEGIGLLASHGTTEFNADRWQEEGPWLLLLVTPLAALVFRRGIFLSLLLVFMLLPMPRPALALELDDWAWDKLWLNEDQRAEQALARGEAEAAAGLFRQPDWQAAAHYKAGQYQQALERLEPLKAADDFYNRGNTLAKLGRLEDALKSYDETLRQQPQHADALHNRKLVEEALKKQQQQQQDQQGESDEKDQGDQQPQGGESPQADPSETDSSDPQQPEQSSDQTTSPDTEQQEQSETEQPSAEQNEQEGEKAEQQQDQQSEASDTEPESATSAQDMEPAESLSAQAEAQWLRKIPDDPGGLLRNKFKYQYSRQPQPSQEKEPW